MWETWVQSLRQEDPLKEMATNSSIFAWKIQWTEEPGRPVHGVTKSQKRLRDFTFTFFQKAFTKCGTYKESGSYRNMKL